MPAEFNSGSIDIDTSNADWTIAGVDDSQTKMDDKERADQSDSDTVDTKTVSLLKNEYLTSMIDKNLLERYQLVDKDSIHLKLNVKIGSVQIMNIFAIPLLTREIVEQKPHLKGGYLRIEKEFEETKSYDRVKEMTFALAEDIGKENFRRTVVIEVAIHCEEIFQIRDKDTGELLRDNMETEVEPMKNRTDDEVNQVVHTVRFEVVTDKKDDGKGREVGNWKIIDWDDMLDGNTFH